MLEARVARERGAEAVRQLNKEFAGGRFFRGPQAFFSIEEIQRFRVNTQIDSQLYAPLNFGNRASTFADKIYCLELRVF